ncbi:putative ABC transport system ATP-binding protein [Stackebrandtia albiflava]|uniref:Putative ABC transport system ATP-binding protein n=1 Tax=Stackebrandtia albiflava TaxID=406432 RepID=A0A562UYD3_9ACTN|nr:ATP-binding cassette domain-containing protein [Stackebrandtia albiflava]TWJ10616.1 putative ABC transport system ATP-binding protein [Stackebrandtia albiflava]
MTLIDVIGVTKRHPGMSERPALHRVDARFYPGRLTVLAGPSGSGKTTLLSIMGGFDVPDSGEIRFREPLPSGTAPAGLAWSDAGYLPQALVLLDELTVAQNVQLPVNLAPTPPPGDLADPSHTTAWLRALDIDHLADRYPSQTSGGEQQRAALARALRLRPRVLFADEPTGQLDPSRVDLVTDVLRDYAAGGAAVIITSHDPAVINAADTVVTMEDGTVVDVVHRTGRGAMVPKPPDHAPTW